MLIKIVGAPVIRKLYEEDRIEYQEMFRELETRKRRCCCSNEKMTIRIPTTLLSLFKNTTGETINESISNTTLAGKITVLGNKLIMKMELFVSLFQDAGSQIIVHVSDILKNPEIKDTNYFIMIGGFSESPILQNMIRSAFPNKTIIIPPEPTLEAFRGAVVYGHEYNSRCG